ncbi:hypothetical protein F5878DRAFT_662745 [Lentinula raphanica]|uniref:Uncharacterized protein n=1 Tax=Lentinula raphanica TaxID=153919 RepID=A0AA38P5T0_9AGAR|nr:hypothetical protein F5878DRAFT_662745 [Lentinula raphanica]
MRRHLRSLPSELLHHIIEYIAYRPIFPEAQSRSLLKIPSPELRALSAANWQLHELCLPFLFAHIQVRHDEDVKKLEQHIALLSRFTRIFVVSALAIGFSETGYQIISRILPQLEQLLYVELQKWHHGTGLLRTILAHPTVTSVLVYRLPDESICNDDLSKVMLIHETSNWAFSPDADKYLNQGMKLLSLDFSTTEKLGSKRFSGLQEIRLRMGYDPVSLSLLSVLSSTHSTLNELWLNDIRTLNVLSAHDTPPFISSFVEESQRQGLDKFLFIERVGLRRSIGPSQEWYVMGLSLRTTPASNSLIEILMLVASSFPNLEDFNLNLYTHDAKYDIDDFVSVLAHFASLRVVHLHRIFDRLSFASGSANWMPPVGRVDSHTEAFNELAARAKRGLMLLVARLAKQIRTLDFIYIDDRGSESGEYSIRGRKWFISGCLAVFNDNRDIDGTLGLLIRNQQCYVES